MTESANPNGDQTDDGELQNDPELTPSEQAEEDVAPEEEQLKGILPQAEPTDGPAPAP